MERIPFPILSDIFESDQELVGKIKSLESYHEIIYEMIDVQRSIIAINSISPQDVSAGRMVSPYNSDGVVEAYQIILDDEGASGREPVAPICNEIENLKEKYSMSLILTCLCPDFFLSIERLLAGAVVTYFKAFNSSTGRSRIKADAVFGKSSDLSKFHRRLFDLRNKHFAHADLQANKYYLSYLRNPGSNEIDLDDFPPHDSANFYEHINLMDFNKCTVATIDFLRSQVKSLKESILSSLSEEQLMTLKAISYEEALRLSKLTSHNKESSRC